MDRIDSILQKLERYWRHKERSTLRLAQIVCNAYAIQTGKHGADPYDFEDEDFEQWLDNQYAIDEPYSAEIMRLQNQFDAMIPELLDKHYGEVALYRDAEPEPLLFFGTMIDAFNAGQTLYGQKPHIICPVQEPQVIHIY